MKRDTDYSTGCLAALICLVAFVLMVLGLFEVIGMVASLL